MRLSVLGTADSSVTLVNEVNLKGASLLARGIFTLGDRGLRRA